MLTLFHKLPSAHVLCWDSHTCCLLGVEEKAGQTERSLHKAGGWKKSLPQWKTGGLGCSRAWPPRSLLHGKIENGLSVPLVHLTPWLRYTFLWSGPPLSSNSTPLFWALNLTFLNLPTFALCWAGGCEGCSPAFPSGAVGGGGAAPVVWASSWGVRGQVPRDAGSELSITGVLLSEGLSICRPL